MIIYTKAEGYVYKSETSGKQYHLYEMVSLGGKQTSDMIAIWDHNSECGNFVNWCAGANIIDTKELEDMIAGYVNEYEAKKEPDAKIIYPFNNAGVRAWCGDVVDDILDRGVTGDYIISHRGRTIKLPDLAEVHQLLEQFLEDAKEAEGA